MLVNHLFRLDESTKNYLKTLPSPFSTSVGEIVYYRTYSRRKPDGSQEHWNDTVVRVTEGTFSIRKNYYIEHKLGWDEEKYQKMARKFAIYMYEMKFLPPGRGLWAMGTNYTYERGSAALNNCGACTCKDLVLGASWTMDMLMCGVGIGAAIDWEGIACMPDKEKFVHHEIPDSREGWVNSLKHLLRSYIPDSDGNRLKFPKFDYSKIRKLGEPIKGFGGTASGPGPLMDLHFRVEHYLDSYIKYKETHSSACVAEMFKLFYEKGFYLDMDPETEHGRNLFEEQYKHVKYNKRIIYDKTRCCADIINAIGVCVVAGNVRRSAEILLGSPGDQTFLNLKNYSLDPSRRDIGWMSNNSVRLEETWQFSDYIPSIAERIKNNGEPGIINVKNISRYSRFGKESLAVGMRNDKATVSNPCVTSDTLVLTSKGYVPVYSLVGERFTAVVDGEKYESSSHGFWSTGNNAVYELTCEKFSNLNQVKIKATKNHRFLTVHDEWIKMEDLCKEDILKDHDDEDGYLIVKSIHFLGCHYVYDCSIPGPNRYVTLGGFYSHNCGEIPLETFELCNLSECFPSKCFGKLENGDEFFNEDVYLKALEFATFYSSTVSLLPTHWEVTNKVIARNRRIGVSLSGIADVYDLIGQTQLTRILRLGYNHIKDVNKNLALDSGVMPSIRLTTVKPSGSISQLAGVSSGMHFPTFKYAIRRIMVSKTSPICKILVENGIPFENSIYTPNTLVFSFPIDQGKTRAATDVSMWEQFTLLATLQREWSDNMVSCTIYFDPEHESQHIEHALAQFIPLIKSVSMLPHTKHGAYKQAPYEGIDKETYEKLSQSIKKIDWSNYGGSDGTMPKFCTNGECELQGK